MSHASFNSGPTQGVSQFALSTPDALIEHRNVPNLEVDAPPWRTNPSAWRHRIPICVLALLGFFVASYMALFQWKLIDQVWDPVFGDGTRRVLRSEVAHRMDSWIGFPDAALGALAYLGDAIYGLAGSTRRWQFRPWMVVIFGFDVIPLGIVSVVLVVLQGAVLGSWCFLCLVSAAISLSLIPFAVDEVWATLRYLHRVYKRSGSRMVLWDAFWGVPSDAAAAVALERD